MVQKRWEAVFNKSKPPGPIPEPKHRIGPEGSSTGASVRSFPKSSVQMVREICLHYVEKCTGHYTDNKQAQRYIYQMAEEIMSQLSAVSAQIKRHENEPAVFQSLLDEWNEAFPPGLSKIGSPKAIANLVQKQSRELDELRAALSAERASKENDIADVLRSMDAQIQTSRNGIISERRQLTQLNKEEILQYQKALKNEKVASKNAIDNLKKKLDEEILKVKNIGELAVKDERARIAEIEKKFALERTEFRREQASL